MIGGEDDMAANGYDGSIRINTNLNTQNFMEGIGRMRRGITGLRAPVESLGRSMNGLLHSLGVGISIAGLVALGKKAIEISSDLSEVQNVVDTAFGNMSYKIEKFAETSITQFGISRLAAKETGSTFMAMGRSMVNSMEDASNMAVQLTARAADMSSFYNKTFEETSTALKSIYTGETETLKAYGVVMTEINLQEFAYQNGIKKKISAMSQAEKVALRYKYVMEQTALAQGDFAKTSDSWANQTRILKEQFKELLGVIGKGLTTVLTPVIKYLNVILSQVIAIARAIGNVIAKLFGISLPTADTSKFKEDLEGAAVGADDLKDSVEKAGKAASKALAPFDKLNVLNQNKDGSGSDTGGAGSIDIPEMEFDDTESAVSDIKDNLSELEDILSHLFNPFKKAWESEGQFVIDSWKYALDEISKLLKQIGKDFLRVWDSPETITILEDILHIIGDIGLIIGHLARNFREAWAENDTGYNILCKIRDIIGIIVHNLRLAADATVEWADNLDFSPLLNSILTWLTALQPLIDSITSALEWMYENILLPIAKWVIEEAVPATIELFAAALGVLNSILVTLQPLAIWLWENFLKPLGEWTGDIIISALKTITDLLNDFSTWISQNEDIVQSLAINIGLLAVAWFTFNNALTAWKIFAPIVTKALSAISTLMTGGLLSGTGIFAKLANVIALAAGGAGTLHEAFLAIFGTAGTLIGGIGSVVSGIITAVVNFFSMLKNGFNWLNEALMVIGTAITAVGAIILGAPALVAAVIAAIIAAVATIVVVVKDNWDAIAAFFAGVGEWFNTNVIQPVISFFKQMWETISGFFSTLWNNIKTIWGNVSGWFNSTVIEPIIAFFQGLLKRVQQIFEGLWIIVKAIWIIASTWFNDTVIVPIVNFFEGLWKSVSEFFTQLWEDIVSVWEIVSDWFNTNVVEPVIDFFRGVWEAVSGFFSDLWDDIQQIWTGAATWFDTTVIQPLLGFFESLWKGIRNGLVSTMNAVISGIESGINHIVDGINSILGGFNKVVSWAAKVAEVNWGGVELIPSVSLPRIPALANGAVIRGGNPFMAVLGDQPAGQTNIETPLNTMVQAFKQAMRETKGSVTGENITAQLILDGDVIYETVIDRYNMFHGAGFGNSSMI